jgi:hypothetical protein
VWLQAVLSSHILPIRKIGQQRPRQLLQLRQLLLQQVCAACSHSRSRAVAATGEGLEQQLLALRRRAAGGTCKAKDRRAAGVEAAELGLGSRQVSPPPPPPSRLGKRWAGRLTAERSLLSFLLAAAAAAAAAAGILLTAAAAIACLVCTHGGGAAAQQLRACAPSSSRAGGRQHSVAIKAEGGHVIKEPARLKLVVLHPTGARHQLITR